MRRIADQHQTRVMVAMRMQRPEWIAPATSHHLNRAEMVAESAADRRGKASVIERQHALCDRGALGPHDGGHVGRAAFQRVGAGTHRQLRERPGRQEVLERHVVVWSLVADRADDAGLVVRQMRDGNAGRPTERRVPPLRCHDQPAVDAGAASDLHGGTVVAPLHLGCRRREHAQCGQCVHARVQRHPQAAGLHHVAECPAVSPASRWSKCRNSGEAAPTEAAVADADVEDGAGRLGQRVPDAGLLEQAARAGGDGVGAAIERRVLHRRQGGTVHHHGGDTGGGQSARQRAAHRAGSDDAHLGRQSLGHVSTVALRTHRRQAVAMVL